MAILFSNISEGNSWDAQVAVVKDNYRLSVVGPGVVPSIIKVRRHCRKQRGSFYLYTRVTYNVKGTSTFHVSRLPLCGDVAINPGPPKPKAPQFSCQECSKTIRRNQDALLCAECSGWSHAKCLHMSEAIFQHYNQASNWTYGLCSLPKLTAKCYQQSFYADSDSCDSKKIIRGASLMLCCSNTVLMSRLDMLT